VTALEAATNLEAQREVLGEYLASVHHVLQSLHKAESATSVARGQSSVLRLRASAAAVLKQPPSQFSKAALAEAALADYGEGYTSEEAEAFAARAFQQRSASSAPFKPRAPAAAGAPPPRGTNYRLDFVNDMARFLTPSEPTAKGRVPPSLRGGWVPSASRPTPRSGGGWVGGSPNRSPRDGQTGKLPLRRGASARCAA
jgi:hypothetical protein